MKGLMLKDFLNLKKQWVIIILLLVFTAFFRCQPIAANGRLRGTSAEHHSFLLAVRL